VRAMHDAVVFTLFALAALLLMAVLVGRLLCALLRIDMKRMEWLSNRQKRELAELHEEIAVEKARQRLRQAR
jgi:hypothetical protein